MSGAGLPAALQCPLAVLDIETTGLHPQRDAIWEIAVLLIDAGQVSARRSWLLDPGQPLPATVAALGGILDAELRGQPRFAQIATELLALLQGRLLVGHNLRFDLAFLRRGLLAAGLRLRAPAVHPAPGPPATPVQPPAAPPARAAVLDPAGGGWRHLGSVRDPAQIPALLDNPAAPFTRDTYRILRSHLRRHPAMEIVELGASSPNLPA